jgi:hypothetical protein
VQTEFAAHFSTVAESEKTEGDIKRACVLFELYKSNQDFNPDS